MTGQKLRSLADNNWIVVWTRFSMASVLPVLGFLWLLGQGWLDNRVDERAAEIVFPVEARVFQLETGRSALISADNLVTTRVAVLESETAKDRQALDKIDAKSDRILDRLDELGRQVSGLTALNARTPFYNTK